MGEAERGREPVVQIDGRPQAGSRLRKALPFALIFWTLLLGVIAYAVISVAIWLPHANPGPDGWIAH